VDILLGFFLFFFLVVFLSLHIENVLVDNIYEQAYLWILCL